ncbi:neural/ectodermal development factor IMP-L2 isoform X2 [Sitophilus oryzae]|nr:neural/ectodermal development factor IMP-L2 isoform X2 [Sitophilus oryzae]
MVILSVLFATLCLQIGYSRRLSEDINNEVSAIPDGNIANYEYKNSRDYVKISQAPIPHIKKNVGSHVEFYCEAMGSPPPTIQWYKDHMRITENESFENSNLIDRTVGLAKVASRLVINYILPRHQGKYYCVAEAGSERDKAATDLIIPNARGREMNFTQLLANKILGAHHRPRVTFWAPAYMDIIGSDIVLPCKSVGNPKPDLWWIDPNSKTIEDGMDNGKFVLLPDGELSIRSITWEDMGVYICMVKNSVGDDSVETFLYPMQESNK